MSTYLYFQLRKVSLAFPAICQSVEWKIFQCIIIRKTNRYQRGWPEVRKALFQVNYTFKTHLSASWGFPTWFLFHIRKIIMHHCPPVPGAETLWLFLLIVVVPECWGSHRGGADRRCYRCGHYFYPRPKTQQHCNLGQCIARIRSFYTLHSRLLWRPSSQEVGYNRGSPEINKKKWSLLVIEPLKQNHNLWLGRNWLHHNANQKYSDLVLRLLIRPSGKISRNKYLSEGEKCPCCFYSCVRLPHVQNKNRQTVESYYHYVN